jgi:hypothetical protein
MKIRTIMLNLWLHGGLRFDDARLTMRCYCNGGQTNCIHYSYMP